MIIHLLTFIVVYTNDNFQDGEKMIYLPRNLYNQKPISILKDEFNRDTNILYSTKRLELSGDSKVYGVI